MQAILVKVVDTLVVVMAAILLLFVVWLLLLHIVTNIRSRRVEALKARLLALINENLKVARLRSQLYSLLDPLGEVEYLSQIRGIRTKRGVRVISMLAPELDEARLAALRAVVLDIWYMKYLRRKLHGSARDFTLLVMKLAGELPLAPLHTDVLHQLYRYRDDPAAQQIGLTSLCALGDGDAVQLFLADPAVRLKLSFRTTQEIMATYSGNKLILFPLLLRDATDDYVRRACIGRIGAEKLAPLAPQVTPYLDSTVVNLRIDAIRALGELRYLPAADAIAAQRDDARWEVRSVVITALAKMDADRYLKQILEGLFDPQWWVRSHAAEALAKRPDCRVLLDRVEKRQDRYAFEILRFHMLRRELLTGVSA